MTGTPHEAAAEFVNTILTLPDQVQHIEQQITALGNDRLTPLAYRPDDVLKVLPIGRDLLFRLLGTGEIESFYEGTARIIPRQALLDYMTRRLDAQRQRNTAASQGAA